MVSVNSGPLLVSIIILFFSVFVCDGKQHIFRFNAKLLAGWVGRAGLGGRGQGGVNLVENKNGKKKLDRFLNFFLKLTT